VFHLKKDEILYRKRVFNLVYLGSDRYSRAMVAFDTRRLALENRARIKSAHAKEACFLEEMARMESELMEARSKILKLEADKIKRACYHRAIVACLVIKRARYHRATADKIKHAHSTSRFQFSCPFLMIIYWSADCVSWSCNEAGWIMFHRKINISTNRKMAKKKST
jgi:hypothetical protein